MSKGMRIGIVGGGLAGCSLAYVLKTHGYDPVIYEAGDDLASGASGNMVGLYNPRFGAAFTPQSQYYAAAFQKAVSLFERFEDIDFNPSGCLHLITDDKKRIRYTKMKESWGWGDDAMRLVDAREASEIAGVHIEYDALFLPQSGSVCPATLCREYARGVEVRYGMDVQDLSTFDEDIVVLAAGPALRFFEETKALDLRAVRGQVTLVEEALPLRTSVCYGGYVSAAVNGLHVVGSTFQRWLDHSDLMPEDDVDNLQKFRNALPCVSGINGDFGGDLGGDLNIVGQRAAVRTVSRDHFPIVGALLNHGAPDLYVSTAHGSHGILSSLMGAYVLAGMITGETIHSLSEDVLQALSPSRFLE